jgi:hypothetical protein
MTAKTTLKIKKNKKYTKVPSVKNVDIYKTLLYPTA